MNGEDQLSKYYNRVQVDEYSVNFVKIGNGPQIIIAFPGIMAPVISSFVPLSLLMDSDDDFKSRFTFYTWDNPGYFRSRPMLRKKSDISFQRDAELGYSFLKALDIEPQNIIVFGYSGGSQAALHFTLSFPHAISKLLLWGAWDRFEEEDIKLNQWYRDLNNVPGPFSSLLYDGFGGDRELALEHWHAWHDMVLENFAHKDPLQWKLKYENFKTPTHIIWGKRDMIVPWRQTEELIKNIPHATYEIMEKAPHNSHLVFSKDFYSRMMKFLSTNDGKDANANFNAQPNSFPSSSSN